MEATATKKCLPQRLPVLDGRGRIWRSWRALGDDKNGGPARTCRLWRPLPYALHRGPIVDATAHERRLRGDGFGDGFGGDCSLVGRSTGGTSGPVVASTAPSEGGSPGWLRLRVGGSSPSSGASQPQRPNRFQRRSFRHPALVTVW